jgi:hypothetical protein
MVVVIEGVIEILGVIDGVTLGVELGPAPAVRVVYSVLPWTMVSKSPHSSVIFSQ